METVPLMLNLMRMSRETICGNKLLVNKLSSTVPTGIIEIRASTIRWILNVRLHSVTTIQSLLVLRFNTLHIPRPNPYLQVMVSSSSSVETRDTSIQILDNFLAQLDFQTRNEPLSHTDTSIISLAAASAVILSTKLHEIRPLCTVSANFTFTS